MGRQKFSGRDIGTKFIVLAPCQLDWDEMLRIGEEVSFAKSRIRLPGKLVPRG